MADNDPDMADHLSQDLLHPGEETQGDVCTPEADAGQQTCPPKAPAKRKRASDAQQRLKAWSELGSFIINHINQPLNEETLHHLQSQAKEYGLMPEIHTLQHPEWSDIVALHNKVKEGLEDVSNGTKSHKRSKKEGLEDVSNGTKSHKRSKKSESGGARSSTPRSLPDKKPKPSPKSSKVKLVKPKPLPVEPNNEADEDELTKLSNARNHRSKGLRQVKSLISSAVVDGHDLTPTTSTVRQKIAKTAAEYDVLQTVDLANDTAIDWQQLLVLIEGELQDLEKQKRELVVARRKSRQSQASSPLKPNGASSTSGGGNSHDAPQPTFDKAPSAKENNRLSKARGTQIKALQKMKDCIEEALKNKEDLFLITNKRKGQLLSIASQHHLFRGCDLMNYNNTDWQGVLPEIELKIQQLRKDSQSAATDDDQAHHALKLLELMGSSEDRAASLEKLRAYASEFSAFQDVVSDDAVVGDEEWSALRSRLSSLAKDKKVTEGEKTTPEAPKVGRKKQRPTQDDVVAEKQGRKKQRPDIQVSVPGLPAVGCPVLELDDGTKKKIEVLRQIRSIAWEDAHLSEQFSNTNLEKIRVLQEEHNVLGPGADQAFDAYLQDGPKELLILIKSALDKLEGSRKKKMKGNAFEVLKHGAKVMAAKSQVSPEEVAPVPAGPSAKELAAQERQKRIEAEKAEKERKAEELQRQKEELKRKKEEEKEQKRLEKEKEKEQKLLEREEEKRKKEAERLQKKEEERKKKEEEKKGPPPKVHDAQLQHTTPLPQPCYEMAMDPDLFQDMMQVYNFVYIFAESLCLTRFPFHLWVQAITGYHENKIIEEVSRQLVALIEGDRSERTSRRGGNWMVDVTTLLAETIGLGHERRNSRGSKRAETDSDSESDEEDNDNCMVCGKRNPLKQLVTCDLCDRKFHVLSCLDPPLSQMPEEPWNCPECVQEAGDDQVEEGKPKQTPTEPVEEEFDPDTEELKKMCERAQELGRHNTYQNWGVMERLRWLKHLVRLALETTNIVESIRGNSSMVAQLYRDYQQQKRDLQAQESAEIAELRKKDAEEEEGEGEEGETEKPKDEKDKGTESKGTGGKGTEGKGTEGSEDGDKEKGKKQPKDKEKEKKDKEEREKRRQEMLAIKEKTKAKQDELLMKLRQAVESTQSRIFPLGEDRYKRLYWRFPGDPHLWVQEVKGYTLEIKDESQPKPKEAPLVDGEEDEEETPTDRSWGFFRSVDPVLDALDDRGIRESKLKAALEQIKWYDDRCPDRLEVPRHYQLRYYVNKFKSSAYQKNPLEWT